MRIIIIIFLFFIFMIGFQFNVFGNDITDISYIENIE